MSTISAEHDELQHELQNALDKIVDLRASLLETRRRTTDLLVQERQIVAEIINQERARAARWKKLAKKLHRQAQPTRGELIVAEATASALLALEMIGGR